MTIETGTADRHVRRGFTLAEAILAMVILAMAAAGVLLPFAGGASVQAEGMRRTLAAALANDLVERIVNTPFDRIVADWHGYSEPQGQIHDAGGTLVTDPMYANFSRQAGCYYIYVPQQSMMAEPVFIFIHVEVHYRGQQTATVSRLISE